MRILFFISTCLISFNIWAQDVQFTASVNTNEVALNESFQLSFTLNTSGEGFKPPVLSDNFKIYSGPNQSSSMSYVNGRISSKLSYSYLLVPINEGKFVIEPATITVEGKSYSSNPIEITVVKARQQQQQQQPNNRQRNQQQQQQQQTQENDASLSREDINKNLFLRLQINKNEVTQGEQLVATYKLYNRLDLTNIEGQKLPDFVGFYTNDVNIDQNNNSSRENINGVVYQVYTLKKTTLFPQRSGELELRPLELTATIREREPTPVNTWFGPRYRYTQRRVELKSNSTKIKVNPLPGGKPAEYTGAVGAFNFSSDIDNLTVKANQALNLKYTLTGTGNIQLVDLPEIDFPLDFEVYDPKTSSKVSNPSGVVSGKRTWEYLVIPRVAGEFEIPEITFSYYDPSDKKYKTSTAKGYKILVEADENAIAAGNHSAAKRDVQQIGKDIRFIKTDEFKLSETGNSFFGTVWFYLLLLLPIIIGTTLYFVLNKYKELQADQIGLRKRRAGKLASKQLKHASSLKTENKQKEFYEEVFRALTAYVASKFAIPMSELTKAKIESKLTEQGVGEDTVQAYVKLMEDCEMARYAPMSDINMDDVYNRAAELIDNVEKSL